MYTQVYLDDHQSIDPTNPPSCTCERGTFRCHHMAVAMLHAYKNVSCTDKACSWSRPKVSGAAAVEVQPIGQMYRERAEGAMLNRPVNDDDRTSLLSSLLTANKHCSMAWLLSPEPPVVKHSVPLIKDLIQSESVSLSEIESFMSMLLLNKEQIEAAEINTRGQRDNPLWGQFRAGRITASNFGFILKYADRSPPESLMKSLMGEYDASRAKAVQWGILHERAAIKGYEKARDVTVQPSGLWLHKHGFCGASPDGIVDENLIIEVKCPFSCRNAENLVDQIGDNFFIHYHNDEIALNMQDKQGFSYYHQIQGNLWLTGRKACDLVVWNPKSMLILTIEQDGEYEFKYLSVLRNFYIHHFIKRYLLLFGAKGNLTVSV